MPRKARQKSKTGIYHIIMRGINRQDIFHDDEDRIRFLETLCRVSVESNAEVLGYCLMSNHVHLLIKEGGSGISHVMKRLGTSYAYWYNWKHEHTGHVFQDRFKSECVENDTYLITVIRYIHRNPVKAKLVLKPDDYYWSSCRIYYGVGENPPGLTQTQLILGLFDEQKEKAVERMRFFEAEDNDDQCLDDFRQKRLSRETARQAITEKLNGRPIGVLQQIPPDERKTILKQLKQIEGLSLRQISRITGLTVHTIYKA
ncbi:MAG: transposase [Peptococcaceae bacterium]|nr:transposase [Peptococcaceae bacterium]